MYSGSFLLVSLLILNVKVWWFSFRNWARAKHNAAIAEHQSISAVGRLSVDDVSLGSRRQTLF